MTRLQHFLMYPLWLAMDWFLLRVMRWTSWEALRRGSSFEWMSKDGNENEKEMENV